MVYTGCFRRMYLDRLQADSFYGGEPQDCIPECFSIARICLAMCSKLCIPLDGPLWEHREKYTEECIDFVCGQAALYIADGSGDGGPCYFDSSQYEKSDDWIIIVAGNRGGSCGMGQFFYIT